MANGQNPISRGVLQAINGTAILFAFASGLLWHLSTVGDGSLQLATILAAENRWAASFAVISAGLFLLALFKK